jgi:hypothetical protein
MFAEIIAFCSDITAEYINTFHEQNAENFDVAANDTYS